MDLHSAAYQHKYVDTTFLCTCSDTALYHKSVELADAFGAPYMYVVDGGGSPTNFDGAAHAQNIPFMSANSAAAVSIRRPSRSATVACRMFLHI